MSSRRLFLSYPRQNEPEAQALAAELQKLGQEVWLDSHLSGGQEWWNTILEQIRVCDCFIFVVNEASLASKACLAGFEYAHALGKLILPVATAVKIHDALLPKYLARTQRVEANDPAQATHSLAKALLGLPSTPALPDPLPLEPPLPVSHLDTLAQAVTAATLDQSQQLSLVAELKQRMRNADEREAIRALLEQLQRRTDLYAFVAEDVKQLLRTPESAPTSRPPSSSSSPPPASPPPPPPAVTPPPPPPPAIPRPLQPAPTPRRSRSGVMALCSVGAALLLGSGVALAAVTHDSSPELSSTSTTTERPPTTPTPAGVRVHFSEEVMTDIYCADLGTSGYADIPFTDVEVFDGHGNLLGVRNPGWRL